MTITVQDVLGVQLREIRGFFAFDHLPRHLQEVSAPYSRLADAAIERNPESFETLAALRKLLEAKDAAVRAALLVADPPNEDRGERNA